MIAVDPSAQETGSGDSVASSPQHGLHLKSVRFMCYFGGEIRLGPNDNKLRYVGGDTHIITVHRSSTFSALHTKPLKLAGMAESDISVKYQLPNGELISVTSDEDVENMMAEYDRILGSALQDDVQDPTSSAAGTIRLFLFNKRGIGLIKSFHVSKFSSLRLMIRESSVASPPPFVASLTQSVNSSQV